MPAVIEILRGRERVFGLTLLHDNLFVLRANCIEVYSTNPEYTFLHRLRVDGLTSHEWNDLTSSVVHSCLYVADCAAKMIRAVQLEGPVRMWSVPDCPCGVSVTPDDDTLLVTCADTRQLVELSLYGGDWLRHVNLSSDIQRPLHAIKLTSGNYVVSHSCARGLPGQHRVCVVDSMGNTLLSYGSGLRQLDWPCHMSIANGEFVFVADSSNNRIVLMSPTMQPVRAYVESLSHPRRLHLERDTRRLYVAELGGRVVAIQFIDSPNFRPPAQQLASRFAQCSA